MSQFPFALLAPFAALYAENSHLHSRAHETPVFAINNTPVTHGAVRAANVAINPAERVFIVTAGNYRHSAEEWALRTLVPRPRNRIHVMRLGATRHELDHIRGLSWPVVFVYGTIPEHVRTELLAMRAYLVEVDA